MKRERRALMDSLAALKVDQGKAGSERQMSDIARLRQELESKQEKVNELRQVGTLPPAQAGLTLKPPLLLHVGATPTDTIYHARVSCYALCVGCGPTEHSPCHSGMARSSHSRRAPLLCMESFLGDPDHHFDILARSRLRHQPAPIHSHHTPWALRGPDIPGMTRTSTVCRSRCHRRRPRLRGSWCGWRWRAGTAQR